MKKTIPPAKPTSTGRASPVSADALTLGWILPTAILLYTGIGYYIGRKTGHIRGWTLAGFLVGLLAAGYELWKAIRKLQAGAEPPLSRPSANSHPQAAINEQESTGCRRRNQSPSA